MPYAPPMAGSALGGSLICMRYLMLESAFLRTRHPIFGEVFKALSLRRAYLSRSIVLDHVLDEVPDDVSTYLVSEEYNKHFWQFDLPALDMVNVDHSEGPHVGGFAALRYLEDGSNILPLSKENIYITEKSLLGIRDWFDVQLLAIGFSAAPHSGYSWLDAIDAQIKEVRHADGFAPTEKHQWLEKMRKNWDTNVLKCARDYNRAKLCATDIAGERFDGFLPEYTGFFSTIKDHRRNAQAVGLVRRAFPNLLPAAPVSLTGGPGPSNPSPDGGGGGGKGKKGEKEEKVNGRSKAGSKYGKNKVALYLSDTALFLAGKVYNTESLAEACGVPQESRCWCKLLCNLPSSEEAMALCPDPIKHGGPSSKMHTAPAKFSLALAKQHSQAATPDQCTEAGWRGNKKQKKK